MLQGVTLNLFLKDHNIDNVKNFVHQAIVNHASNLFVTEKKYYFPITPPDSSPEEVFDKITNSTSIDYQLIQEQMNHFEIESKNNVERLYSNINELPPKQRAAVLAKFDGTYSTKNSSQHTNYTIAIRKLRNKFKENKNV